jgi:hypothetical protein
MSATGLTAGAAVLVVHPTIWIAIVVVSSLLAGLAIMRYRDERANMKPPERVTSARRPEQHLLAATGDGESAPAVLRTAVLPEHALPRQASLGDRCLELGNAIESFFFARADGKPKIGLDTPADQQAFQRAKQLRHDLETELLYRDRFDAPVATLVAGLRARHDVAPEELHGLTSPEDRGAMFRVGETLQRLGKRAIANYALEPAAETRGLGDASRA